MSARPVTRYVTASPETWSLIRGAYLSGLSGPTVAARFGISVTALRKRARREGWTKAAFAAVATPWRVGPGAAPAAPAPAGPPGPDGAPTLEQAATLWRAPMAVRPAALARKALAGAAEALKTGQGLNAVRLARAASEIARLDALLEWEDEDPAEAEAAFHEHQKMMTQFLTEKAVALAEDLAAGRDLPAPYAAMKHDRDRRRAAGEEV